MADENYLEQAKSFLSRNKNRLALRVVPMALMAAAAAHAVPNFNVPGANSISNCSGGATTGSLSGVVANSGHGVVLSGSATLSNSPGFPGSLCVILDWRGTGSGTFDTATLPGLWNFAVNPPGNATVTGWTLTFTFNPVLVPALLGRSSRTAAGSAAVSLGTVTTFTCSSGCSGTSSAANQAINVPISTTFASYEANLRVNANWSTSAVTTLTVDVPGDTSIHINAPLVTPGVPAPSTLLLMVAGLGALTLGRMFLGRKRTA